MSDFIIYTDGCCLKNGYEGARGGWAYVIYESITQSTTVTVAYGYGGEPNTTNNRMEMTAVIMALSALATLKAEKAEATVYSDSAYLINGCNQKWYKNWQKNGWITSKKTPVENQDLWKDLIPWFENDLITFEKVKGHAGVMGNEVCDTLAKKGAQEGGVEIYVGSDNPCV